MTMHPDIQKKAQEELDAVIGNDRLPTLADRDSLPYLNTMLKEAIRWGPTTPLGAPHCIEQDDVHEGYFIPKGSIVMANIWYTLSFLHFVPPRSPSALLHTGGSCMIPTCTRTR